MQKFGHFDELVAAIVQTVNQGRDHVVDFIVFPLRVQMHQNNAAIGFIRRAVAEFQNFVHNLLRRFVYCGGRIDNPIVRVQIFTVAQGPADLPVTQF